MSAPHTTDFSTAVPSAYHAVADGSATTPTHSNGPDGPDALDAAATAPYDLLGTDWRRARLYVRGVDRLRMNRCARQ